MSVAYFTSVLCCHFSTSAQGAIWAFMMFTLDSHEASTGESTSLVHIHIKLLLLQKERLKVDDNFQRRVQTKSTCHQ